MLLFIISIIVKALLVILQIAIPLVFMLFGILLALSAIKVVNFRKLMRSFNGCFRNLNKRIIRMLKLAFLEFFNFIGKIYKFLRKYFLSIHFTKFVSNFLAVIITAMIFVIIL